MLVSQIFGATLLLASPVVAAPVSLVGQTYTLHSRQNAAVSTLSAAAKADVAVFADLTRYVVHFLIRPVPRSRSLSLTSTRSFLPRL